MSFAKYSEEMLEEAENRSTKAKQKILQVAAAVVHYQCGACIVLLATGGSRCFSLFHSRWSHPFRLHFVQLIGAAA